MPIWDIALHVLLVLLAFAVAYLYAPKTRVFFLQRQLENHRALTAQKCADFEHAIKILKAAHETELLELADSLRAATKAIKDLDAVRADWQLRAETRAEHIVGAINERQVWQDLHRDETVAHGNAQVIMMDAVSHLERRIAQARIKYPDDLLFRVTLPPIIQETQALYTSRFLEPVLQASGTPTITRQEPSVTADTLPTGQTSQTP